MKLNKVTRALFLVSLILVSSIGISIPASHVVHADQESAGGNPGGAGKYNITVRTNVSDFSTGGETVLVGPNDTFNTTNLTIINRSLASSPGQSFNRTNLTFVSVNITDNTAGGFLDINNKSTGPGELVDNVTLLNASTGAVIAWDSTPNTTSPNPNRSDPHFNLTNIQENTGGLGSWAGSNAARLPQGKINLTIQVTLNRTFGNLTDDHVFATNLTVGIEDNGTLRTFSIGEKKSASAGGAPLVTQRLNTGNITNTTTFIQAVDTNASINITYSTTSAAAGIKENTINLTVKNLNLTNSARNRTVLVDGGTIETANASTFGKNTVGNGQNDPTEYLNLTAELQEGYYNFSTVNLTIVDNRSNVITADASFSTRKENFLIDMSGDHYSVIADSPKFADQSGTLDADEKAVIAVVIKDTNGHNVTLNDTNIHALGNDTALLNDSGLSVTTKGPFNSSALQNKANNHTAPVDGDSDVGGPIWFRVTDTERETVTLTANDTATSTNGRVKNGTATQKFKSQQAINATTSVAVNEPSNVQPDEEFNTTQLNITDIDQDTDPFNVSHIRVNITDGGGYLDGSQVVNVSLLNATTGAIIDYDTQRNTTGTNPTGSDPHFNITQLNQQFIDNGTANLTVRITLNGSGALTDGQTIGTNVTVITNETTEGELDDKQTQTIGVPSGDGSDTDPPSVTTRDPNGGELFKGGSTVAIEWSASDASGIKQIELYYASPGWTLITTTTDNDGHYQWTVPEINTTEVRVKVRATDNAGNSNQDWGDGLFTIDSAPPTPQAGQNQTVTVNTSIAFDASNSTDNIGIDTYVWEFGDGTSASGVTPSHTYTAAGSFTVTLTVTDTVGHHATDSLTVEVLREEVALNISANVTAINVTEAVRFTVTRDDTGNPVNATVSLNGTPYRTGDDGQVVVRFDTPGTITATASKANTSTETFRSDNLTLTVGGGANATGSVTFDDQTVPENATQVTVASANYSEGAYVIVVYERFDNGSLSAPIGFSSNRSGSVSSVSIDLAVDARSGDHIDALTENVTLVAKLHATGGNNFGDAITIDGATITDEAAITVANQEYGNVTDEIAGVDNVIQLSELQDAIQRWANDDPLPSGRMIELAELQTAIQTWATDARV